jgi:membrane-associated HD superfamily phosphohydrolase
MVKDVTTTATSIATSADIPDDQNNTSSSNANDTTKIDNEDEPQTNSTSSAKKVDLNRVEDGEWKYGFTNGRLAIWKAGLKSLSGSEWIMGITEDAVIQRAANYLDETMTEHLDTGGLHNLYLTVLLASGILGFILFVLFIIFENIEIIGNLKKRKQIIDLIPLYVFVVSVFAWCFFETRILYNADFIGAFTWLMLGVLKSASTSGVSTEAKINEFC